MASKVKVRTNSPNRERFLVYLIFSSDFVCMYNFIYFLILILCPGYIVLVKYSNFFPLGYFFFFFFLAYVFSLLLQIAMIQATADRIVSGLLQMLYVMKKVGMNWKSQRTTNWIQNRQQRINLPERVQRLRHRVAVDISVVLGVAVLMSGRTRCNAMSSGSAARSRPFSAPSVPRNANEELTSWGTFDASTKTPFILSTWRRIGWAL